MTDERAMEILDPDHREHYESIEPINEACRIGIAAIKRAKELEAENAELRARLEKAIEVPFVVLDKTTGKEAGLGEIALYEEWAKSLVYCDMDGFAITQDGALLLLDECGKFEYCPSDRFEIVAEARLEELKEDI